MEVLQKMGKFTGITAELAVPESNHGVTSARRAHVSAQVVIGTPGTLKKWISFKKLGLNHLKILVFDEADHMLATVCSLYLLAFVNFSVPVYFKFQFIVAAGWL